MQLRRLLFASCLFATPSWAQDFAWTPAQQAAQATSQSVITAKGNLLAIGPHVTELEKALTDGPAALPGPVPGGVATALTDGPLEVVGALVAPPPGSSGVGVQPSPYPDVTLYLALYYNEVHRYDDALRVIEAGLKLALTQTSGAHLPRIFTERVTAYAGLKRFGDALATCDAGLALKSGDVHDRARMQRCRGFDLTELNRLDEAETAYKESLKLEPNNPLAMRELGYIANLQAGGRHEATGQVVTKPGPDGVPQQIPTAPARPPI